MKEVHDIVLSFSEVAAALNLTKGTILSYVSRGTLSCVYGVPLAEVERYQRERKPVGSKPFPDIEKILAALEKQENTKSIPDREQSILRRRASGESQGAIGESLGLSRQRVQQLEKRAIESLTAAQPQRMNDEPRNYTSAMRQARPKIPGNAP